MAGQMGDVKAAAIDFSGRKLVRRFTDGQTGKTTLEHATKALQEEQDALWEEKERQRLSVYYRNPNGNKRDVYFHQAERAKEQLDRTCEEYFKVEKSSSLARLFGLRRKTSRDVANEVWQQYVAADIQELESVVNGLETKWREKQSRAFSHLRRLCSTLYAHKKTFALLPSQNNYASSLCGGVTLLISAAVNYDEIAETLSETVANIGAKVSSISELVEMIETQKMYERYAELHAHVFLFYRDVIAWYMQRKRERFFKSFNEQLQSGYKKAMERINDCIQALLLQVDVARLAIERTLLLGIEGLQREVFRQRQQLQVQSDIARAGLPMQNLLYGMLYSKMIAVANGEVEERRDNQIQELEHPTVSEKSVDRATALAQSTQLLPFVVGDEGQSLFTDGRFWIPHAEASPKLVKWMDQHEDQSRLWISSPLPPRGFPSSRAGAMTAVVAAWQSPKPIISHFCERARLNDRTRDGGHAKLGLIGLVYSLIVQLLQFRVQDDAFKVSKGQMEALNGSDDSWKEALRTFSDLLQATPQLSICVIDDLNVLALSAGMRWCTEFLDVLFEHQQTCGHAFRILLTTTGNSKIIPEYFERDERVYVQRVAQEVLRRDIQTIGPSNIVD